MSKKKVAQKQSVEPWLDVTAKLDTLIRLSALNIVKGMQTQKEQIAVLSDAGFQPREIADIIRTSSNSVSVALTAIRKERASTKAEEEKEKQTEVHIETPVQKSSQQ